MRSTVNADPASCVLLETKAVTRRDERSQATLLNPTDLTLRAGDSVSLSGSSGSGKSVLLRTLALLDAPDSGEILWKGLPVSSAKVPQYRSRVCYLAQRPALIDGTVEDNLRFPYSLKTWRSRTFDLNVVRALLDHAGKPQSFLSKIAADLSGGEAQIASLVRALQLDPQVLLLDEPTAALDPASVTDVEALIRAWFDRGSDHAYIWVSHDHQQALRMSTTRLTMNAGVLTGHQGL
jgi:putative ABC transport system ATP-binding protein